MKLRSLGTYTPNQLPNLKGVEAQHLKAALAVKQEVQQVMDHFQSLDGQSLDSSHRDGKVTLHRAPLDPTLDAARDYKNGRITGTLKNTGTKASLQATVGSWGAYKLSMISGSLLRPEAEVKVSAEIKGGETVWQSTTTQRATQLAPTERYSIKVVENTNDGTLTVYGGEKYVERWDGPAPK